MRAGIAALLQTRSSWLAPSFALAVVIGALTLMPQPVAPMGPQWIDKLYHLLAFAALVFPTGFLRPKRLVAAGVLALFYGAAIELIQPAVGRSGELGDLLADGIGILVGIALGLAVRRRLRPPAERP
jgi:VanZ family protein